MEQRPKYKSENYKTFTRKDRKSFMCPRDRQRFLT